MAHTKYTANYSFNRYFRLDDNAMAAASVWKGGDGVRVAPVSMGCSKLGQSLGQARRSQSGGQEEMLLRPLGIWKCACQYVKLPPGAAADVYNVCVGHTGWNWEERHIHQEVLKCFEGPKMFLSQKKEADR